MRTRNGVVSDGENEHALMAEKQMTQTLQTLLDDRDETILQLSDSIKHKVRRGLGRSYKMIM